ncbi:MAG TPA: extracellular solute-binding protein, partial [Candidatus Dormibacteraeota bacterium]|nr:extracellular solute-binding protein [Candidatus Dormibacteraeota bacterium]
KNGKRIPAAAKRDADIWTFWNQGKIAMFQDYLDYRLIAQINPEQIGIAPIPLGPTGIRGSEVNSTCMGMYAGIKDPRVRQAAWAFMRFWTSRDAVRIRTQIYIENGYGRFLNPADLRRYGHSEYLRQVPKGWEKVFAQAMQDGVPEPCGKNCDLIYEFMTNPLEQALVEHLGEKPLAEVRPRIMELLKIGAADTNERMIGWVPPDVLRFRKRVALVTAMGIILAFIWAFRYLMRIFTPQGAKASGWGSRKHLPAYLMLVPALTLMFVWQYVPSLRGSLLAFTNYRIMGGSRLVGLENFANVLFDHVFWDTLGHSLWYAGLILLLGFTAPILLAVLLH